MRLARLQPLLLPLFGLGLAIAATGCTKHACFQWTELEGECPAQEEALIFFQNEGCTSSVRSIDSAAEFDGELCCYEVTTADTNEQDVDACISPPSGGGGVGGVSPPPSKPVPGRPPFPTEPSPIPPDPCVSCLDAVLSGSPSGLCAGTELLVKELTACACGTCADSCGDNVCVAPGKLTDPCIACVQDTAAGCGDAFNACVNDPGF